MTGYAVATSLHRLPGMKTAAVKGTAHGKSGERSTATATVPRDWDEVQVSAVMTPQPQTIGRDQTLATAHRMMRERAIRHLPVLEAGEVVGIVTQRDLYFLETIRGVDLEDDIVEDAMTPDAYAVAPDVSVAQVARTMAERKLGCAVVREGEHIIGIFTATDALRLIGGTVMRRQVV